MKYFPRFSSRAFLVVSSLFAVITVFLRGWLVPFNHDEVATFFHYVQPGEIFPFHSEIDANNHFLNTLFSRFTFMVGGDHPFVLRLPNMLSVFIMIFGCFRLGRHLKSEAAKYLIPLFFLLTFYWISFLGYCRGYGMSMALLVLSLSYFIDALKEGKAQSFLLFVIASQLALAANLILVIPLCLLTAILAAFQFYRKTLFRINYIFLHILNAALVLFWVYYSFYLKNNGALYYGEGDSYFRVTFITLQDVLFNSPNPALLLTVIALLLVFVFMFIRRNAFSFISVSSVLLFTLLLLVAGFYLMKILLNINFPEDRTALFFYVFAVLTTVFILDELSERFTSIIVLLFCLVIIPHTAISWNVTHNHVPNYEVIPSSFFHKMEELQKGSDRVLTIGAYRMKQLIFAFMNYRNDAPLSLLDPQREMLTYTDLYIGNSRDSVVYKKHYDEVMKEPYYNYVLLKRKSFLKRDLAFASDTSFHYSGENEFLNFDDTHEFVSSSQGAALAEVEFTLKEAPDPFKAWVVLEIQDENGERVHYQYRPLNWIRYDWKGNIPARILIPVSHLPVRSKRIVCYLWNIKKQNFSIEFGKFRFYYLR